MSDNFYKQEELTDYLLGLTAEKRAEDFDELSVADDDFVFQLQAAEDELIDSYLSGALEKSRRERFEAYYLASRLRREKLQFAKALRAVALKNPTKEKAFEEETSLGFFASFFAPARLAFVALALLAVGGLGWIAWQNSNKQPDIAKNENSATPTQTPVFEPTILPVVTPSVAPSVEPTKAPPPAPKVSPSATVAPQPTVEPKKTPVPPPNAPSLASFVLLPPVRSGALQTVSLPAKTKEVAFSLPLEADDFQTYRVALKNQAGATLWQSGALSARQAALNVRFPAKLLENNIYLFSVAGEKETGEAENIGDYSFRVALK